MEMVNGSEARSLNGRDGSPAPIPSVAIDQNGPAAVNSREGSGVQHPFERGIHCIRQMPGAVGRGGTHVNGKNPGLTEQPCRLPCPDIDHKIRT